MFHVKHFLLFLMVLMVFNDFKRLLLSLMNSNDFFYFFMTGTALCVFRSDADMDRTGGRAQTMVFILCMYFSP